MKIIISGAFGHIGSYLLEKFQKDKTISSVLMIDNFYTQRFCNAFNIGTYVNKNSHTIRTGY